jgi:hypothetical protein
VGEGSERFHFYSGRRTFIGSEGSQAVYYLLAMLDWRKVKRKLSCQVTDFSENAEGYRNWAVTVFGLNGKIQACLTENRVHLYYTTNQQLLFRGSSCDRYLS